MATTTTLCFSHLAVLLCCCSAWLLEGVHSCLLHHEETHSFEATASTTRNLIFGGTDANPNEYPFFVQQYWNGEIKECAASLIASKWVLTTAHCVDTIASGEEGSLEWRVGSYCREGNNNTTNNNNNETAADPNCGARETWAKSVHISVHPFWDRSATPLVWDFGLVELDQNIDETPLAIDNGSTFDSLKRNDAIQNIGMGVVNNDLQWQNVLQKATNLFQKSRFCFPEAGNNPSLMCTVGGDASTCRGDNGSPAMVRRFLSVTGGEEWVQVGITSFGIRQSCGPHDQPEGYARVAAAYPWIVRNVCRSYTSEGEVLLAPAYCADAPRLVELTESPTITPLVEDVFLSIRTRQPTATPTHSPTYTPTSAPTLSSSSLVCLENGKTRFNPNVKKLERTKPCRGLARKRDAVKIKFCVKKKKRNNASILCCNTCRPFLA